MEDQLKIMSISKTIDNQSILSDISFTLEKGTKLSVLGPSGRGKTTLRRIIAGLESPDSGSKTYDQEKIDQTFPIERNFGQKYLIKDKNKKG